MPQPVPIILRASGQLHERPQLEMRTLDRALWQYAKEDQPSGIEAGTRLAGVFGSMVTEA